MEKVEKEVVLDTYLYVSMKGKDMDKSSEEIVKEAQEKMMKALDQADIDYQIFSGELRDKE